MAIGLGDTILRPLVSQAAELSADHVASGGIPFAALVVDTNGETLASGVNRVLADHDPLAHAEIVAMHDAAARLKRHSLAGAILIASGEPCGLCYLAARYFGISDVIYAVDRHQAAQFGFDYVGSYRIFAEPPERWAGFRLRHLQVDNGLQPFTLWDERHQGRM